MYAARPMRRSEFALCSWWLLLCAHACLPPPPGLGVVVWLGVLSVAGVLLRVYGFGVLS